MIKVYHVQPIHENDPRIWLTPDHESLTQHFLAGAFRLVAEVPTDDLEVAWFMTNSINDPWYERTDLAAYIPEDKPGIRSSMVGDVFVLDGMSYFVNMVGFDPFILPYGRSFSELDPKTSPET